MSHEYELLDEYYLIYIKYTLIIILILSENLF